VADFIFLWTIEKQHPRRGPEAFLSMESYIGWSFSLECLYLYDVPS
jgi:hypothetical protein